MGRMDPIILSEWCWCWKKHHDKVIYLSKGNFINLEFLLELVNEIKDKVID